MAYNALNNLIDAYIYANGVQAITGQILNGVLKQMVSQLGSGYHLMGVAGPGTVPEQNDYAMAYFAATAGEYTDFGGITLTAGEVAVLLTSGNGSWEKQTIYTVPTTTEDLENTAGFITNAVTDLVNYYTKTEVDDTLAGYPTLEALATALADYYTKTEIDTILAGYTTNTALASALADYYNKNDIDGLLSVVNAALADRYTKSETDTKLGDYYKKTETYDKDEVDSIVAALSRQEYIVAWDGLAEPDVSAIPAGVTVTYNATPYTGTLDASASTVNKIYMVWNGVAYDMYGTSQDGGYSWVPMGTTTVDLSQYATKAEVSQLQQEVGESERVAITYTDDYFVNTNGSSANVANPTSSSSWRYALVPCSPGEKFTVSGRTTSATVAAIWCFIDSSYNILSRVASDATEISDVSLTAPEGTAYLLLNDNKSGAVSYEGMTLREIVNEQGNELEHVPEVVEGIVDEKIGRYEDIVTVWSDGAINSTGGIDATDYFEHSDFIPRSKYGAIRSYTKLTTARLVVVFFQEDKSTVVGYKSIADYGVESNEWATFNIAWIEGAAYCKVNRAAGAGSTLKGYTSVIQDVAALKESLNVFRFDTRLSEFRLELLPVGSYIGNDGQIYTSTTPPYRGTIRLDIEPNTELYAPDASYYLLYKNGSTAITNLVAMPADKKVIVPVGASGIVFDCPPLSVDFLDIVVKRNTVNPSKLWLLPVGQYYGSDGTIYDTGAWRGSSKVSVSEGDKIRVPLAAYYLTWNGSSLVRGLTAPPANKIITIPSGVDSIAFDISPNDDLKEIEIEYLPNIDENHAQWKGKQWYAFGCSISDTGPLDNGHTETGTYPAFLVGMSGLVHHNWAWGGSCIADRARTNSDGQHPTAVQRIDAAIEEGSIANADLITIDGAYNDYGANVPLGEITDKEDGNNNDSTFFMALYQAVMKLKAVAPNARIVFLTDNTGQTTQQQGDISEYYHKNSVQGLFQRDYQKAMIEFAKFVGVSVIDCGGKSGISSIHPQYLADHIHQSQLGGLQFAQTIWEELKEMQLMKR